MFSLCVTHHLVGVAFNTMYPVLVAYVAMVPVPRMSIRNVFISVNLSYLGGLHSSIPIQRTDLVMCAHNRVETSCISVLPIFQTYF
jgi:hypothetical protein